MSYRGVAQEEVQSIAITQLALEQLPARVGIRPETPLCGIACIEGTKAKHSHLIELLDLRCVHRNPRRLLLLQFENRLEAVGSCRGRDGNQGGSQDRPRRPERTAKRFTTEDVALPSSDDRQLHPHTYYFRNLFQERLDVGYFWRFQA